MKPPPSSNSTHHHHFYPTSLAVNTPSLTYSVSLVFSLSMAIPHGQVCIRYFQYQPYSSSKQNHALFCSKLQAVTDSKQTQSIFADFLLFIIIQNSCPHFGICWHALSDIMIITNICQALKGFFF